MKFISFFFGCALLLPLQAFAAWYLACNAVQADNSCPLSAYSWVEVGTKAGVSQKVFQSSTSSFSSWSNVTWLPNSYSGNVTYALNCNVQPVNGTSCTSQGMVLTYTSMNIPAFVACVPAARTIDPCPSGYAPSSVDGSSGTVGDSYSSAFEKLPIQDMLYGIGMAICGLLGFGVGTKLV